MADAYISRDFVLPESKVAVLVNGQYFSTEEPGIAGKIISAAEPGGSYVRKIAAAAGTGFEGGKRRRKLARRTLEENRD